ncbi:ADP-ribosylglycohydrolase family protein, partial [Pelodictyon luteolum]|uniref:ADP-ribosylglycohydrolase family protein n=1 Tax=Pelodictyon luteolum TaxID=1100 RepID=UPI00059C259B
MSAYRWWWGSEPFVYGRTMMSAMLNMHDHESQANGALMRISPLGIFCSRHSLADAARWAKDDAALTHPHPKVGQANALYAESLEEGVVDTLMQGGDTDTNAAVCGALLGAVYGIDAIPEQWKAAVLNCRPEAGTPGVHHPRLKELWPLGALELAEGLVTVKMKAVAVVS